VYKTFILNIIILSFILTFTVRAESVPSTNVTVKKEETLYFTPLPTSNPKLNLATIQPVANYLSKILNRPVKVRMYQSYDEIIQAFLKGEIQFAEFGPLPYLKLQDLSMEHIPLVSINKQPNSSRYECVLAAPIDGIQSLNELNNLEKPKIALTQPLSTCGWLVTNHLLKEQGFNLQTSDYQYLGSHHDVALALIRKEYSVGGLARFIAERYQNLGLEILKESTELPPFTLVIHSNILTKQEVEKVSQALLDYNPKQHKDFNSKGFSPFNPDLFNQVIQLYPNRDVPLQNSQGVIK